MMEKNQSQLDLQKLESKLRPSHKDRYKLLSKAVDEDGNLFTFGEDKEKIYFHKKETRDAICLGTILVGKNNLLYHKFEDERNIFRNTNSWTINYTIFEQVDLIVYETLKYTYIITKARAAEFGEIIKFQETKINIPLDYWDKRRQLIDPTEARRRNLLGDNCSEVLKDTINSPYMSQIGTWLRKRRTEAITYPEENEVFRAYKTCHFKHVKVVILGTEPYNDSSSNGLAFGFKDTSKKLPSKSLNVIFKEVERDVYNGFYVDFDNTLVSWAEQGVLLLNSILTVERNKPKSHSEIGWQRFIKITLYELLKDIQPKVFICWGAEAINLYKEVEAKFRINSNQYINNLVLTAKHPAADLYNADNFGNIEPDYPNTFAGNKHFSQANNFLVKNKRKPIKW